MVRGKTMNYNEALDYIHGTYKFGSKLGLENINYLLELMGNPHKDLKVIHVAGTNGKGSTSSYINSILVEEGYKVGLFTSPYLEEFTERIQVNNKNMHKEDLGRITEFTKSKIDLMLSKGKNHPTEFEIVTAIAFQYFKEKGVDYVVLEVGMGGRLDSTNVIENPLVSVITPISLDHTDYLGDTIDKIAFEKAGIIKKNGYVVSHPQEEQAMDVVKKQCKEKNSRLFVPSIGTINIKKYDDNGIRFDIDILDNFYDDLEIGLLGEHQVNNVAVALTTVRILLDYHNITISNKAIKNGLKNAKWPGRMEIIQKNPIILIDGAHNLQGAVALRKTIERIFTGKNIIGVLGILGDKDYEGIINEIIPLCSRVIVTRPNNPRALSVDKMIKAIEPFSVVTEGHESIVEAVNRAVEVATAEDIILCCGSLYMIGGIRSKFFKR